MGRTPACVVCVLCHPVVDLDIVSSCDPCVLYTCCRFWNGIITLLSRIRWAPVSWFNFIAWRLKNMLKESCILPKSIEFLFELSVLRYYGQVRWRTFISFGEVLLYFFYYKVFTQKPVNKVPIESMQGRLFDLIVIIILSYKKYIIYLSLILDPFSLLSLIGSISHCTCNLIPALSV